MINKIKYIITTAAFLLAAVVVSGQNKSLGVNLSLWNGVATQPYTPQQKSYLNLGIATKQYNLYGVGINLLGTLVKQDSYGLQFSGLYHIAGEQRGVSFAGLAQMVASDAKGINVSGLFNIIAESHSGLLATGLFNIVGNDMCGVNLSGLFNITGNDIKGVSIAGLSTISEYNNGITISGLFNITGKQQKGIALSGLFNLSDETVGLSATSLVNTTNKASGVQLSLFNIASQIKGAQIGLININGDGKYGYQLGLINLNPSTKIQAMAYGGNLSKTSLALRFKNNNYYNIIGISTPSYLSFSDKFSGAILYRTGGYINLSKHFDLSADIGYQHINSFKNRHEDSTIPHRMYALEGRINLEYNISNKLGLIATGGYGTTKKYNESHSFRKGWIAEGGLFYTLNKSK